MTTFHLVRHAEKASDPDVLTGRAGGVHLTGRGLRQSEQLARKLAHAGLQRIFSSPLERAQQTAAALARATGLPVEVVDALTELDWGDWTGRRSSELEGHPEWFRFNTFRSAARIPGGESFAAVQFRVVEEMLQIRTEVPEGAVALVSHGDPIKTAVLYFLGLPLDAWMRIEVGIASITTIELGTNHVRVIALNEQGDEHP